MNKIVDAGEVLPYARKHQSATENEPVKNEIDKKIKKPSITLAGLWVEPDWIALKEDGVEPDALVKLFIIYSNIRKTPRGDHWNIPASKWENAYLHSIDVLKDLFSRVKTLADTENLFSLYLDEMKKRIVDYTEESNHIKHKYPKFATGKENKRKTIGCAFSQDYRDLLIGKWLVKNGWPENRNAINYIYYPVEMEDGTWRVAELTRTTYCWTHEEHTFPDALAICSKRNKEKFDAIAIEVPCREPKPIFTPKKNKVFDDERIGPCFRSDDVSAEELLSTFGFRGIQFGNALSDVERRAWVNNAFDAFHDLAEVLNMKPSWMALPSKGNVTPRIGIAFGARGIGGSGASAHFEPSLNVINMTRLSGFGSAAHEWAHALDLRLGLSLSANSYLTENMYDQRCLLYRSDFEFNESQRAKIQATEGLLKEIYHGPESMFYGRSNALADQKRAKKYWTKTCELFARAFESYVQDKLLILGRHNPWLVHGTLMKDCPSGNEAMWPYPINKEREKLNQLFDIFFATLKS